MRILVTGGTGYVGRRVVPELLDAGLDVNVMARPDSIRSIPSHRNCNVVQGDPLDPSDLGMAIDGCQAVVHLVGIKRKEIKRTGLSYDDVDVRSVGLMAGTMANAGVRRIVLLSAGAIGHSTYVQSKAKAERIVIDAGLDWTIFRPSYIVGPGQQWPRILTPLLGVLSLVPGRTGDIARRAADVSLATLARSIVRAVSDPGLVGAILDVPRIRALGREKISG